MTRSEQYLENPHPGIILAREFIEPFGLSRRELALAIGLKPQLLNAVVRGEQATTASMDLRLGNSFGVSVGFFLGLQVDFDLMEERRRLSGFLKMQ